MTNRPWLATALLSVCLAARADDAADVRAAVDGLYRSLAAADLAALSGYLPAGGFTEFSPPEGTLKTLTRDHFRGVFASGAAVDLRVEQANVRALDRAAIVTGYRTGSITLPGGKRLDVHDCLSMIWARDAATWTLRHVHISACAGAPLQLTNAFVLDDVKWVRDAGDSTVTGRTSLRLRDGSLKSCAGFPVELLPVAGYSSERIFRTYASNQSGQILVEDQPPKFTPDAPDYHEYLLKGACDARGEFRFEKVPAGEYYVMTFIIWDVPGSDPSAKTGGAVMKRIRVAPHSNIAVDAR
ncbi:MAG TPA: nuclear transport factor 2 family protein [Steroidobacteraceae bacterium]|nr:nuclear transport factor 2 family protein [Steroidobacteraceae bacterium]